MPKKPAPSAGQNFSLPYNMLKGQEMFAKAVASGAKVVLFLGGIRSGKSYAGIMECLKQMYVYGKKPSLGWIISPTYPMSMVPERMFKNMCYTPTGSLIAYERKGERSFFMKPSPKLPNELYRVEFKSADDPDRLRGASVAWALLDEASMMKPEVFQIMLGRILDSNGLLMLTTTPRGKNWLYSDVYLRSLSDPRYISIVAKTEDNVYLSKDEVTDLYGRYASKSDNFAKQEMDAQFVSYEGVVFDQFKPEQHILGSTDLPDNVDVICGVDFGYNDPFVCVFLAKYDGVWFVVDEYYRTKGLVSDHAAYLKNHPLWPQVRRIWCDPSGLQMRREFQEHGIRMMPARRSLSPQNTAWPVDRARLINSLFSKKLRNPLNKKELIPALVLFDRITFGVKEIMAMTYERSVEIDGKSGVSTVFSRDGREVARNAGERLSQGNDHVVDALGYALFSEERSSAGKFAYYEDESGSTVLQAPGSEDPAETQRKAVEALFQEEQLAKIRRRQEQTNPYDTLDNHS